jgi:signal transduction histidine kinase
MSRVGRVRVGFGIRMLVAQALVLLAGALTVWLVASAVGPSIFAMHLRRAGVHHTPAETLHVDRAFGTALLLSLGVALLAATVAALAVTWYFTSRVQRSIASVAAAASDIADGHYDTRVADPGLGTEFARLAGTYNALARRLATTEATRRRMLADLAHEMRTPLATIDAQLEAIEDGLRDPDAATLAVLGDSSRRLRRLAEDMSAVSRAEEGSLSVTRHPVVASVLARSAFESARERFDLRGVELRLESDVDDATTLTVDPDRIGQVLGNLLDNALRHTPPGGNVTISCRQAADGVEYAVADTGAGIPPGHLPRVFDRFYRVDTARDRASGGSGIGLAIAKALVEAHQGRISAHSRGLGEGATFVVWLPAS